MRGDMRERLAAMIADAIPDVSHRPTQSSYLDDPILARQDLATAPRNALRAIQRTSPQARLLAKVPGSMTNSAKPQAVG